MLYAGLMSGTSMDGIDASIINDALQEIGHASLTYSPQMATLLQATAYAFRKYAHLPSTEAITQATRDNFASAVYMYLTEELQLANYDGVVGYFNKPLSLEAVVEHSTQLHGQLVQQLLAQCSLQAQDIKAVGYHGQTFYFRPQDKIAIILGDGQQLANMLGIEVVADFRSNDLAHGGTGAPLAPLYHYALAKRDNFIPAAVVNCGGIANITYIPSANENDIVSFDTGAGNCLIDKLVRQRTNGAEKMDKDGQYALQGKVLPEMLECLYAQSILRDGRNYFALTPPKALEIKEITLPKDLEELSLPDACATLAAFTAGGLIRSLEWLKAPAPRLWILAGGGWHNPAIFRELHNGLQQRLGANVKITHADEMGWNGQALEAQIFAYLAGRSLQRLPLSLPNTTGVKEPMTGGQHYTAEPSVA